MRVHHWRLQFPPLQRLRRRLLTRCAWCGGRSRRGDPVDTRLGDCTAAPWWRGETGLHHVDCASVRLAKSTCCCPVAVTVPGSSTCVICGSPYNQFRTGDQLALALLRELRRFPDHVRDLGRYQAAVIRKQNMARTPEGTQS